MGLFEIKKKILEKEKELALRRAKIQQEKIAKDTAVYQAKVKKEMELEKLKSQVQKSKQPKLTKAQKEFLQRKKEIHDARVRKARSIAVSTGRGILTVAKAIDKGLKHQPKRVRVRRTTKRTIKRKNTRKKVKRRVKKDNGWF